jgi:hypothetical protein
VEQYKKIIHEKNSETENKLSAVKKEMTGIEEEIKPFISKIRNKSMLGKLQKQHEENSSKLKNIEKMESEIKNIQEYITRQTEAIFAYYGIVCNTYKEIEKELKKDEYKNIGNVELKAKLKFRDNEFVNKFEDLLDKRLSLQSSGYFDNEKRYIYDGLKHADNIRLIFNTLLKGEDQNVKLKSDIEIQDAVLKLLEDYFTIEFNLIKDNDEIMSMSPGKKGLVLLKFYLQLSNEKYPILIDQPEDNLDNRTIYTELNDFIKEKKIERQIIIVSHNPNLVVSTDSEEIIVANQSGQQQDRDNKEHKFEFFTGALEFSFKALNEKGILYQKGIREHVCEILEGGEDAFRKRENKYNIKII